MGGTGQTRDETPEPVKVLGKAQDLRLMVDSVTPDEFYWQEAHYDHDSRLGRELLFLMANHEWARATSEIVDITRADEIQTTIKVEFDLSQITHEAFRKRTGRLWLPLAVLPPQIEQGAIEPDLFATVTDGAGNPVPMLPAVDLRHQMAAAMAEIIAKMAASHPVSPADAKPGPNLAERWAKESPGATRDERLLLSAAIYRMLQPGASRNTDPAGSGSVSRVTRAREALRKILDSYIDLLEARATGADAAKESKEPQFVPELARRAIKVLEALAESVIVVVLINNDSAPSVLTVQVPIRKLEVSAPNLNPWTWIIRPWGRLRIGVLLPTADADRKTRINLPDGVSVDEGKRSRPHLDIPVDEPSSLRELSASMEQVSPLHEHEPPIAPVEPFVDLARAKSARALDMLQHYQVSDKEDRLSPAKGDHGVAGKAYEALRQLAEKPDHAESIDAAVAGLKTDWQDFQRYNRFLFRRTSADRLNPQTVLARAGMIEDVSQRATPRRAVVHVDVTVDDRDYFSTARSSAFMSLALMVGILCFFLGWHIVNSKAPPPAPEVLAIVLTLFVTIQASRIERPDRSTLRGQLFAIGNWLIAASVFPAITLAIALAFHAEGRTAVLWTGGCILSQILLLASMWRGPLTSTGWPRIGRRRTFDTVGLDYKHFEALRSDYWRNTTAEALMIGRKAHGYVIWQKADPDNTEESISPKLRPLLIWGEEPVSAESSSVLALLRSGTLGQAVTSIVFRGKPDDKWLDDIKDGKESKDREVLDLELDPGRLVPTDSITSMVDVFVGIHRNELPKIAEHPLVIVLKSAANKLIVLDAQLPVPPPPVAVNGDRRWARIRVALRDREDILRLAGFLKVVNEEMARPANARHVVAVQAVPAVGPRVITASAIEEDRVHGDKGEIPVLTSDLDIVNSAATREESADAPHWRVLTICADARSNIESDIVQQLASVREHFQLAGLTYALLHGTAVIVLLVHDRTAPKADPPLDPAWARLETRPLSRNELEPVTGHPFPLLRVRFRWQDRPGGFLDVLNSISTALEKELPWIKRQDWSISYARLQVESGQVGVGRLTIRMHLPAGEISGWDEGKMEQMGRKIEMLAAEAASRQASGSPGDVLDKQEDPVIGIDRIKKIRPTSRQTCLPQTVRPPAASARQGHGVQVPPRTPTVVVHHPFQSTA
jgi:hypothetical protein